jgi:hypothetical protein
MTIGEVARRSGVAASALRFYEDRGLISSERAGAGHRRCPRTAPPPGTTGRGSRANGRSASTSGSPNSNA